MTVNDGYMCVPAMFAQCEPESDRSFATVQTKSSLNKQNWPQIQDVSGDIHSTLSLSKVQIEYFFYAVVLNAFNRKLT